VEGSPLPPVGSRERSGRGRRVPVVVALLAAAAAAAYGVAVWGAPSDSPGGHVYVASLVLFGQAAVFLALARICSRARTRAAWLVAVAGSAIVLLVCVLMFFVGPLWLFIGPFGLALLVLSARRAWRVEPRLEVGAR